MQAHASTRFSVLVVSAVADCGGKVVLDGTGGAPTATTGSSTSGATGGSSSCPILAPDDGDPCTSPGLTCEVALCGGPTATCSGGTWQVPAVACAQPCLPCGAIPCGCPDLCVDLGSAGPEAITRCAANPCGTQPPSCACAGSLCPSGCVEVTGTTVVCNSVSQ